MSRMGSAHGMQRRVLVPILTIGGILCFARSLSHESTASVGAMASLISTGLTTWLIAGWVTWRGISPRIMFGLCLWADAAIVMIDLSNARGEVTALAMFALPSVMTALYGTEVKLAAQALAAAIGSVIIVQQLDLSAVDAVTQASGALLATISPAVAVLLLRRRLDATLARERLLGITDPLTLVTNRRGLDAAIPEVLARAQAAQLPIGLAVIDIDHFKRVNDRYGHSAGDAALQKIAALIRECVRVDDVVCRLGGEEFAVLAAISPAHLCALGERIRESVEESAPYRITVSVGATWQDPTMSVGLSDPEQVWALLNRADELMYLAKNDGRNCMRTGASGGMGRSGQAERPPELRRWDRPDREGPEDEVSSQVVEGRNRR